MSRGYLASEVTCAQSEASAKSANDGKRFPQPTIRPTAVAILPLLLGLLILFLPPRAMARSGAAAQVSVGIAVSFGPPPLPVYEQPLCPGPGYIWTPGYWAWDPDTGYYWVPGTWVPAPFVGALWTPGYWGWEPARAVFIWHAGYWGPRVGFYGGINYGFGYFGVGYDGGYWRGRDFFYNRAVNRIDVVNITHVYDRRVVNRETRVSYNGGRGGIMAQPTRNDFDAERERRMGPIDGQRNQERMARGRPEMRWSQNHGRPDIAATPRPEMFRGNDVSRATRSGGDYRPEQPVRSEPYRSNQPRSFGRQPEAQPSYRGQPERQPAYGGQPERQPSYRGQPERRNQPTPNRNEGPSGRNQAQPPDRGQQGRGAQRQAPRERGNQNRQEKSNKGEKGRGGPPPRD